MINWTNELSEAFEAARAAFVDFVMLQFQRDDAQLILTTDASETTIGGILEQIGSNSERQPLAFYSRKLEDSQLKWCTYDKELFALYSSVEHFMHLVEGRNLELVTDHKLLIYMFTQKGPIKYRDVVGIFNLSRNIRLIFVTFQVHQMCWQMP